MSTKEIRNGSARSYYIDGIGVGTEVDPFIPSTILGDNSGVAIKTKNGALAIYDPNAHDTIVNRYAHLHTGVATTTTLAVSTSGATNTLTVTNATGFTVGKALQVGEGALERTHPIMISIVGNVITLDRYLDSPHLVGTLIEEVTTNMSLAIGTLVAPITYIITPPIDEVWHVERLLFEMTHSLAADLGKFGGIAAIANGVIIRINNNGVFKTLTNWKDNSDIKTDMYDVTFDARSGGQGAYGTSGGWTLGDTGAVPKLDGSTFDQLEILVQDDLTGLVSFTMKAQGHVE